MVYSFVSILQMRKLRLRTATKLPRSNEVVGQEFELSSFPFKTWRDEANGPDDILGILGS